MTEKEIAQDQEFNIVDACKLNLLTVLDNLKVVHEQMSQVKEDAKMLKLDNFYVYKAFDHMSHSVNHLDDAIANFGVDENDRKSS